MDAVLAIIADGGRVIVVIYREAVNLRSDQQGEVRHACVWTVPSKKKGKKTTNNQPARIPLIGKAGTPQSNRHRHDHDVLT